MSVAVKMHEFQSMNLKLNPTEPMRSFRHPREVLNPVSKRLQLGADIGQMAIGTLIREQLHILTTSDARQLRVLLVDTRTEI